MNARLVKMAGRQLKINLGVYSRLIIVKRIIMTGYVQVVIMG